MSEPFENPRIAINRVYTRRGDSGETSLVGGKRVPKDSPRIEAYGTVDELNALAGAARISAQDAIARGCEPLRTLAEILLRVQHELFNLGSILATLPEDVHPKQARVTAAEIERLETEMDQMNQSLEPLRSFVLPGGSRLNADLHICRTVCRRAERIVVALGHEAEVPGEAVRYLNRLSDAFFVWSRWASHVEGFPETLWQPNRSSSGEAFNSGKT
jgi:cob(I)alamin adenosyltransferase